MIGFEPEELEGRPNEPESCREAGPTESLRISAAENVQKSIRRSQTEPEKERKIFNCH